MIDEEIMRVPQWSAPEPALLKLWSALGIADDPRRQQDALQKLAELAGTYLQHQKQAGATPSPARQRRQLAKVAVGAQRLSIALIELMEGHFDAWHALHLQNPQRLRGGPLALALSDLVIDLGALQQAAIDLQAALADRTGPRSHVDLHFLVIGLCRLYEEITFLPATHNPKILTKYDGNPHSEAGLFVQAAIKLIDWRIIPQQINTAVAYAVGELRRQKAGSAAPQQ